MRYPALSEAWLLDRLNSTGGRTNGYTVNGHSREKVTETGHSKVLHRAKQVFPLTLFPDQVVIEELRVVWVRKNGPWTYEVISTMATDIAAVYASNGLLFGQIHIKSLTGGPEICVDNLLKKDVHQIRNLVEGIAMSAREGLRVETDNVEAERQSLERAAQVN